LAAAEIEGQLVMAAAAAIFTAAAAAAAAASLPLSCWQRRLKRAHRQLEERV
jgi:hypothetical protein